MYNMIFGESKTADALLALLGLKRDDFYRYRDCYLTENGEIAVYTRGGGGNRRCICRYYGEQLPGEPHRPDCPVVMQAKLRQHPWYKYDENDEFDCTYATFYFQPSEEVAAILTECQAEPKRDELWVAFLTELRASAEQRVGKK